MISPVDCYPASATLYQIRGVLKIELTEPLQVQLKLLFGFLLVCTLLKDLLHQYTFVQNIVVLRAL